MDTVLLTGFPGFLGSRLLPLILRRQPDLTATCLVQDRFATLARDHLDQLGAAEPAVAARVRLVAGDITATGLGVDDRAQLQATVREVWHLAAVYDLTVERGVAEQVNVRGTQNVLRFAEDCPRLLRHHYVSTCYVSGRHCGPFRESDLDVGQTFNNHYEATKFEAEVAVADARSAGMPTTVYRPSVVVGDSRTGETQKFDGPYFLIQLLERQGRRALLPMVGDPTTIRFNMVPSDFVVDAIDHLASLDHSAGVTYQVADPAPLTVDELATAMCEATGRAALRVHVPRRATRWALANIEWIAGLVGVPAEALDYLTHPTHYDTANTVRDLTGSAVACPPVRDYLPTLVAWMRRHRDAGVGPLS